MKLDIVQPISLSLGIITLFGMWKPYNRYINNSIYTLYTYILHFLTTFTTTTFMLTSVVKAKTLEQFTDPLFMAFTMFGVSVKVINMLYFNSVAVNFVERLKHKHFHPKTPNELKIFKNSLRMFFITAIVYTAASFAVFVFGFSIIAFGQKWILPYPMWLPFEYRYESKYYWMAYSCQFSGMFVGCLSNVALDMVYCYFLKSVSLVYFSVSSRLANIGDEFSNTSNNFKMNKIFLEEIKKIIDLHSFAKELREDCQRLVSAPIFVQVLLSAFVLCFTGYRLSSMSIADSPGRFIEMMDFLFVMALQIYLPCHYGNQITFEAGKLSDALFSSNWTVLPEKSRKLIFLYMEFLKDPIYVRAGKFFQIGIPTFAKTVNNAYSFFAVLIRIQK